MCMAGRYCYLLIYLKKNQQAGSNKSELTYLLNPYLSSQVELLNGVRCNSGLATRPWEMNTSMLLFNEYSPYTPTGGEIEIGRGILEKGPYFRSLQSR